MAFAAYLSIGLPNALVLAVTMAGVLEAVPMMGQLLGPFQRRWLPLDLLSVKSWSGWSVTASFAIQPVESGLMVPRVMRKAVDGVNPFRFPAGDFCLQLFLSAFRHADRRSPWRPS